MEQRSLKYIAEACNGVLESGADETLVSNICTDSRLARSGDLFIALIGEKFDAHSFLIQVAKQGATAVLVQRELIPAGFSGPAVISVKNTREALGRVASRYRSDFSLAVIAVGGSNGKTTTKELIASVLRQQIPAVWSEASFNNDIGVPLTLFKIKTSDRAAVIEAGTNHKGELAPLLRIIRPRYSVITSLGREHLEFFEDMAGVVEEEGALAELLPGNGLLFVNAENPWIRSITRRCRAKVISIGWAAQNDYSAKNVRLSDDGVRFWVNAGKASLSGEYEIKLLGRHQVLNAMLAIAVGAELGIKAEAIRRGLLEAQPAKMRMQLTVASGVRILDDTYNANADSVCAALDTLASLECSGRKIAVLGDMAELGKFSAEAHAEVGQYFAGLKLDHLFAVGKMAREMAQGAGGSNVTTLADTDAAIVELSRYLQPADTVLLKASRSARLERIVEFLKNRDS